MTNRAVPGSCYRILVPKDTHNCSKQLHLQLQLLLANRAVDGFGNVA